MCSNLKDDKDIIENERLINEANVTLERVISWINSCDQKTGIILGIIGVMFSLMLSLDYLSRFKAIVINLLNIKCYVLITILSGALICLVIGILYLIATLVPRIDSDVYREKRLNTKSKIFFNTISQNKSYAEYYNSFINLSEQDYLNDLLSQIYINSKIASKKHKFYDTGLKCTIVSAAVLSLVILLVTLFY